MLSGEENINKDRDCQDHSKSSTKVREGILANKPYACDRCSFLFAAERDAAAGQNAPGRTLINLQSNTPPDAQPCLAIETKQQKEIDKMFYFKRVAKELKKRPSIPLEYRRQMYSLWKVHAKPGQETDPPWPDSLLEFVTKERRASNPHTWKTIKQQDKRLQKYDLGRAAGSIRQVKILDKLGRYESFKRFIKVELNEAARRQKVQRRTLVKNTPRRKWKLQNILAKAEEYSRRYWCLVTKNKFIVHIWWKHRRTDAQVFLNPLNNALTMK